jgi:DnaJ-domain-containing protein 1
VAERRELDPLQQAHESLAMQAARIQQLEGILYGRAVTTVNEFIDGLTALTGAARAGDPNARQNLGQVMDLLEQARLLASGIVTARTLPPNERPLE